jgi:hypothetical protein
MAATSRQYQICLDFIMKKAHGVENQMHILPDSLIWEEIRSKVSENRYIDPVSHTARMIGEYNGRREQTDFTEAEILHCRPGTPLGNQMYQRITAKITGLLTQLKKFDRHE